mmetsp:Transcript_45274/g.70986  ORF Transcript_45274/g.70986 Transcript_45274/m.70986 type:complete len:147 (+) Transcript_45274:100-540(+)
MARHLPVEWLPELPAEGGIANAMFHTELTEIVDQIATHYPPEVARSSGDPTVYTGAAGVAYLFWRLAISSVIGTPELRAVWLDRSSEYIDVALGMELRPDPDSVSTFTTGMAGVYAVGLVIGCCKIGVLSVYPTKISPQSCRSQQR